MIPSGGILTYVFLNLPGFDFILVFCDHRANSTPLQLCHAVDTEHLGKNNASVAFIAACPSTRLNEEYVKRQLTATLNGVPSPDYSIGNDLDESKLKGYVGLKGLDEEAKRAFGFHLLDEA